MLNLLVVYAVPEEKIELSIPNCTVYYCKTGVGKVSAALAVESGISKHKPDVVINIGTAGSVIHKVGSIHLCCRFFDRDMEKLHVFGVPYGEDFTSAIQESGLFKDWVFDSTCNTGDTFLTNADGTGDVFDMESFAVARVCRKHHIPFLAVKYVTDKIGENSVKHWEEKLAEAQHGLQQFMDNNPLVIPDDFQSAEVKQIIENLDLQKHPEGGWYNEVYRSRTKVLDGADVQKSALTSIYYLLDGKGKSVFHRIKSPEIWYLHRGMPLIIHEITPAGDYHSTKLSNDAGGKLQYTVEPGNWFAAELEERYGFALVSCAVAPGFEFDDFEMGDRSQLLQLFPLLEPIILEMTNTKSLQELQ